MTTTIWSAKFRGHCHLCGFTIRVGVDATWLDGSVVHADCLDATPRRLGHAT